MLNMNSAIWVFGGFVLDGVMFVFMVVSLDGGVVVLAILCVSERFVTRKS